MKNQEKTIDLYKHEVINGGAFKEGLCYVKNYDGKFVNDYSDPRDAMEPDGTIDVENVGDWPLRTAAFRVHEDETIDVIVHRNVEWNSYLRQDVWEIWMSKQRADPFLKGKWVEYPNAALIALDSPLAKHHSMIGEMLKFDGIDISQFGMLKE